MNKTTRLATAALVAVLCMAGTACGSPQIRPLDASPVAGLQVQAPTGSQASAVTEFGERLYSQAIIGQKNAVISPLSAFTALGMAYEGAAGSTAQAFQDVLGMSPAEARSVVAYLLATWQANNSGTTVTAANSAWLDKSLIVEQGWVDRLKAYYGSEVYSTSLGDSSTVGQVNGWVKGKTNGLIPKMLDEIDPETVALLVNALYLDAAWAQPFDTNETQRGTFTRADGSSVDAWYMGGEVSDVRRLHTDDAEGIVLPYKDGRLAFMAVMPASGDLSLAPGTLSRWLSDATDTGGVSMAMPKFHTEFGVDLKPVLQALGLGVAVDPSLADFSGLGYSAAGPLFISQVSQKVSMDVGEKGTKAAAATAVGAMPTSSGPGLVFDKPYVYAVIDQVTGVPLFIGAMDDPSLAPPTAK